MKPVYLIALASAVIVFAGGFAFGSATPGAASNNDHTRQRFMDLCAMQIYPAPFTHQQCEQRASYVFDR